MEIWMKSIAANYGAGKYGKIEANVIFGHKTEELMQKMIDIISEEEWKSVKENLNKLNFSCPVVFGEEFECKCMSDKQFKCPAGSKWGVISPNGTYRKCLHYYEK